jgi:hypothetical protein
VWHKGEGFTDSVIKEKLVTRYVYRNWLRYNIKHNKIWDVVRVILKMSIYSVTPKCMTYIFGNSRSVGRLTRGGIAFKVYCVWLSVLWNICNYRNTMSIKNKEIKMLGHK